MKIFTSSLIALLCVLQVAIAQETVTLTCNLVQCLDKPNLYRFNGVTFEPFQQARIISDSVIQFSAPKSKEPEFYYIGMGNNVRPLLLGTEKEVTLEGSCPGITQAKISGSLVNAQYEGLKNEMNELKQQTGIIIRRYRMASKNEEEKAKVIADMKVLDEKKINFLDSLKKNQPFLAKIAALETYISYDGNANKEKYINEVDYFANEFFQFVDFKDKTYEELPWVYEAFQGYAGTLSGVGLSDQSLKNYLEKQLQKIPQGSRTHLLALSGVITILKQRNNPNFAHFAEAFVNEFKEEVPAATADLRKQLDLAKSFAIGGEAPDFSQKTPEGEDMKLSDLRGKVVLIDFWASWCGPCRRENPNVVKMYNEYKEKGFEILGVSLDQDKSRWLQAIEKDGLTWYHVSDLKGWGNEVAQLYSVRSIPHTVLLDAEGKIIARNLRGAALEQKLAELFE